jgi:hypothetical protein
LRLNADYFRDVTHWDRDAILTRADWLISLILARWPAFGQPPAATPSAVPLALVVRDERFTAETWRQVAFNMAKYALRVSDDFDALAASLPSYFFREAQSRTSWQLNEQWWMMVNLSGNDTKRICRLIAERIELTDDDWEIETK